MSKTSKTTYRNIENDKKKGKLSYQERLVMEKLAEQEIEEALTLKEEQDQDEFLQTYQIRG